MASVPGDTSAALLAKIAAVARINDEIAARIGPPPAPPQFGFAFGAQSQATGHRPQATPRPSGAQFDVPPYCSASGGGQQQARKANKPAFSFGGGQQAQATTTEMVIIERREVFTIDAAQSPPAVVLGEQHEVRSRADILAAWKCRCPLVDIPDLFNDKLAFAPQTFAEAFDLNREMLRVAKKYEMFEGSTKAVQALRHFLTNFELLQTALGEVEASLQDAPPLSGKAEALVRNINAQLVQLDSIADNRSKQQFQFGVGRR